MNSKDSLVNSLQELAKSQEGMKVERRLVQAPTREQIESYRKAIQRITPALRAIEAEAKPGLVTKPGKGWSEPMIIGGKSGRFNWDVPPIYSEGIGRGKSPMYLFVQEDGQAFWRRLEIGKQGGRWEEAWHARAEWDEMLKGKFEAIERMWGNSEIAAALKEAAMKGMTFEEMVKFMQDYNTWRQISGD